MRAIDACIDCPGWQMQDDREALRDRAKKAEARVKDLELLREDAYILVGILLSRLSAPQTISDSELADAQAYIEVFRDVERKTSTYSVLAKLDKR